MFLLLLLALIGPVTQRTHAARALAAAALDGARGRHEALRAQRLAQFMEGFGFINARLKETYRAINMGGDAEMEPRDHVDPFAEGIDFTGTASASTSAAC